MHTVLLVFEFLGTTELLVIAVVALILFGPRKLPEIGRTVGKGIAEFKRASDDFKRTWEYEVELERRRPALDANGESGTGAEATAGGVSAEETFERASPNDAGAPTVARGSPEADEAPGGAAAEGSGDAVRGPTGGVADANAARAGEDGGQAS